MSKLSKEVLDNYTDHTAADVSDYIKIGMSTCGLAAGASEIYQTFLDEVKKRKIPIQVQKCGCVGKCYAEPLVEIKVEGLPAVIYGKVTQEVALEIVEKHLVEKTLVNDYIFDFRFNQI